MGKEVWNKAQTEKEKEVMLPPSIVYGFKERKVAEIAAKLAKASPSYNLTLEGSLPGNQPEPQPKNLRCYIVEAKEPITAADACKVGVPGTGICYILERDPTNPPDHPLIYWLDNFGNKVEVRVFNLFDIEYPTKTRFQCSQDMAGDLWIHYKPYCEISSDSSEASSESSEESSDSSDESSEESSEEPSEESSDQPEDSSDQPSDSSDDSLTTSTLPGQCCYAVFTDNDPFPPTWVINDECGITEGCDNPICIVDTSDQPAIGTVRFGECQ